MADLYVLHRSINGFYGDCGLSGLRKLAGDTKLFEGDTMTEIIELLERTRDYIFQVSHESIEHGDYDLLEDVENAIEELKEGE